MSDFLPAATVTAKSGSGLFSFIGNLLGLSYEIHRDSHLTGAQKEQNAFTESQNQASMNFQANEAQKDRDFQEQMYNQYNSPQALVRQYQEAGINPALMFGGQTPAASSNITQPAGSATSGAVPSGGNVLEAITQLAMLEETLRNNQANRRAQNAGASKDNAEARNLDVDTEQKRFNLGVDEDTIDALKRSRELNVEHIEASIEQLRSDSTRNAILDELTRSDISKNNADIALKAAQATLYQSMSNYNDLKSFEQEWRNNMISKWHMSPEMATKIIEISADSVLEVISWFIPSKALGKFTETISHGPKGSTITRSTTKPIKP